MIFIAGGGIAGLMVLEIIPNPFAAPEEEMAEEDSNGEGSGNEGGSSGFTPPERQPILFTLEDLIIPVILDARVVKRVYITARMEIVPGNRSAVDNGLSRMESALNENLIVYFQNHFANNRRLDLRGIKRVMMRSAEQVYGDMVSDVLLLTVFEQENHHRSPANSLKISDFLVAPRCPFWHPPGAFPGGGASTTPIILIRNSFSGLKAGFHRSNQ